MRVVVICARCLELFDYLSVAKLVLPKQCYREGAAKNAPSWQYWNSAAKLAVSLARLTILAASMVNIYQTCSKYGNLNHTWRIFGSARQYDHARKVFSLYFRIVEIAYQRLFANPQVAILL